MSQQGEWQIDGEHGSVRLPDYGDVVSDTYVIKVLRELAWRDNAAKRPVGVLYNAIIDPKKL